MSSSSAVNGPVVLPSDSDGTSTTLTEPPARGMSFESLAEAKRFIIAYYVKERLPYLVLKADRRAWILTCKDKNCTFRLRVKNTDSPIISVLEPHTCSPLSFQKTAPSGGPITATPYNWPHDRSFAPDTTALVVIDMQRDFCSPDGFLAYQGHDITDVRQLIPGLQRLVFAFRGAGYPIYHTREGHRPDLSTLSSREAFRSRNNASGMGIGFPGPLGRLLVRGEVGHDTIPELYPVPGEPVIDKPGHGAFAHTDFELLLRNRGIKNLVMAGLSTDVSVSSTVREASDRGFDCLLVVDGTLGSEPRLHESACKSVRIGGGVLGATGKLEDITKYVEQLAQERRNGRS